MEGDRICPRCAGMIPRGIPGCPHCQASEGRRGRPSETVLLLSLAALGILFAITGLAARAYHARQQALAQQWIARGEQQLQAGEAGPAVVDFRTVLVYSRDNNLDELRLAQALVAAHRVDEARSYLDDLRSRQPESGPVNLELGRLTAQTGPVSDVVSYYHSAIYGDWAGQNAVPERRAARLELYTFLMSKNAKTQAQAELVALAASLPPEAGWHVRVGRLFLENGDANQALKEFQAALQLDHRNVGALAGAGEAEFGLARYRQARSYLERALRYEPRDPQVTRRFQTANAVLSLDPYEPQLPATVRAHRVMEAYRVGRARLQDCARERGESLGGRAPATALQSLYARAVKLRPRLRETALGRDPDLMTAVMEWVDEVESLTTSYCGAPQGLDEALVLIAHEHGGA